MWVDFELLPPTSRIWIYQLNRSLQAHEEQNLLETIATFCEHWTTHGQPMRASARIEFHRFLVLVADEDFQQPSGCSIDSSVRVLKEWQAKNGVNFFDRTQIPYLENEELLVRSVTEFRTLAGEGKITGQLLTFDNLVPSKGDFEKRWKIEIEKSWLAKYLAKPALQSTT